jgi:3-oxoacyl-[acyl-carrier-protein] synthase-3
MRLNAPDVTIVDVETCDFGLVPSYDTETVLRTALPDNWQRYLGSSSSMRLMAELGVRRRHLTHLPGQVPDPCRLNAFDLARSAVARMQLRRTGELEHLDALIFVSTSNPNPCNSQAALLAEEFGLTASCLDLKAGCSGGVLGLMHAALLIASGCERVLVVMAENLSQLTPPDDLRMLLTVGDGAACVLLERRKGPGFISMIHGSAPRFADTVAVRTPFPPAAPDASYLYEFQHSNPARDFLHSQWRQLYRESLAAGGIAGSELAHWFFHQTHAAQVEGLLADLGVPVASTVDIVRTHGNMGTPTFAVAMADAFATMKPGQKYLMQAVGGGVSWCAILAEHR